MNKFYLKSDKWCWHWYKEGKQLFTANQNVPAVDTI